MSISEQELVKNTSGECLPKKSTLMIEMVSPDSSLFDCLKKEMYISDDYETELRDLIKQKKAVVLAVEADGRYVGRVTLRYDWGDETSIIEKDFSGLPQMRWKLMRIIDVGAWRLCLSQQQKMKPAAKVFL